MALFVNACLLVLLNFEMVLLLEAYYDFGLDISKGVDDANLVPLAKYSFVVLVNLTIKQTYCTGAIITRTFVLTVAHCVDEELDTSVVVYRGNFDDKNVHNTTGKSAGKVEIKGYEERKSVAIMKPWLYKKAANILDIALIQVDKMFTDRNFVRTTIRTPFIQYNVIVTCKVIGFNVGAIPTYRFSNTITLTEETITVKKHCEKKHKAHETYSSRIVQQDEQFVDDNFAVSAALLLCSGPSGLENNLNGIAIGNINVCSEDTPNITKYPLSFTDICPYLSWIRSLAGPSVIRSPGHFGKDCFYSDSSIRTQTKSRMAWFVVVVCILLYL